jgi:type IV pilus assembly protein PilW
MMKYMHLPFGRTPRLASLHSQRGASLIELMVGMTIGLMVVLAATSAIMVTRQGSTTVTENYRLTTAGNNAMRLIAFTIRQAGAVELDQAGGAGTPVLFGDLNRRGVNSFTLVSGTEGGANSDSLTVSYQHRGPNVTRDCLGNSPSNLPDERIDNIFAVNNIELQCTGRRGIANTDIAPAQAIVGDNTRPTGEIAVENFQVLYWVQTAAGLQRRVTATDVPANGGWPAVDSVEICLQLRGIRSDYPASNFTNCAGNSVANGGQLHQVFRSSFKLRNRFA